MIFHRWVTTFNRGQKILLGSDLTCIDLTGQITLACKRIVLVPHSKRCEVVFLHSMSGSSANLYTCLSLLLLVVAVAFYRLLTDAM